MLGLLVGAINGCSNYMIYPPTARILGLKKYMNNLNKGKLKRWNKDRGFGFITPDSGGPEVFMHISALKKMGRPPVTGDIICYSLHTDNNGKIKAVDARIEGLKKTANRPINTPIKIKKNSKFSNKIVVGIIVIFIVSYAYKAISPSYTTKVNDSPVPSLLNKMDVSSKNYSCSGKVYCSAMTSCEEAMFYQNNCPGTKMDGDGDGVPCERQWCGK